MRKVYLDNNATTQPDPEVVEAMLSLYKEHYGNASSIHSFGREARKAAVEAREQVASCLGAADEEEIIFTDGGSVSDNIAIIGAAKAKKSASDGEGNHIITSQIEHPAVLRTCEALEREGVETTYVPVDEKCLVSPGDVKEAIRDGTILITIMYANNETGALQPLREIAALAREREIPFHTDAVQAVGKIDVKVDELGVDMLSLSAHKFHGPKGVGALYVRKGIRLAPIMYGGHHEKGLKPGTTNVPGIVGLGKAIELAQKALPQSEHEVRSLRDKLHHGLAERVEITALNGPHEERLPNTVNLSFPGTEGESLVLSLDLKGIAVSTGAACTSGSSEPSHVLSAMGISREFAQSSLRFSLSKWNSEEDIEQTLEVLPQLVQNIRDTAKQAR